MISLIVPVYNVKPYLKEFLDSVSEQSFDDYEAILVDDGSNDGSGEMLDEYAEHNKHFKVFHKKNEGIVRAWKLGLAESQGEYISFADPDDILKPTMLYELNRLMTENSADLVITGITRLENGKLSYMSADNWNLSEGLYEGERLQNIKNNLFGNNERRENIFFFARWNKLFKKDVLLWNLHYSHDDLRFGEDVCCSASAIYDCEKLYYSHEPLYIYRIRDNSLTTYSFNEKQIDNAQLLIARVRNLLTEKGYMNDFVFYKYPTYQILWLMRKIKQLNCDNKSKKQWLKRLKSHSLVADYNLKVGKKYISKRRYFALWLLKHSWYTALLKLL